MAKPQGLGMANGSFSLEAVQRPFFPLKIGFRLGELLAHTGFHVTRFGALLLWNTLGKQRSSSQALLGRSIAELCASLGATFIKIGQILSTRHDLFPQEIIAPLAKLQDRVKPFAFRHVQAAFLAEFGRSISEMFAEFEEQPIASASIASVYRARLHSGQWVAVKVRRPGIVQKVEKDLWLMRFMARGLSRIPALRLVPVIEMVNELGTSIEQQLDLRIEAHNTRHFREQFAHNPQVLFPVLIEKYCSQAILVMEFIDGLVRIDQLHWEEAEYQESLITGLRVLYHMIFLDGFIHCDLHPGNLYLRKRGQVVILDTGFIAKMEPTDRYQFAEFFLGIATNAGKKCAHIIYETALSKPATFDREGFEREVMALIERSTGSKADTFQVAPFAAQIFDIERRFGLRGSINFTMAILSLLVFEGIAKQLYPFLDFQAEAKPFLFQALAQRQ
ncbi:ABC1 kinase family protein [Ktedonobacter racemifer]|uniref:ABC-1 domain protein n=1 Tax=Ktedonobacter racemifer DSM 44963 TaxID=485913 RepID=D6TE60_KTERA|nr:AarF/UbiB family protein [Ktedonobacter racemifer]EFH88433.1 ABC-1 domain protein [Ktedonobacter racemifer DSM 44963]